MHFQIIWPRDAMGKGLALVYKSIYYYCDVVIVLHYIYTLKYLRPLIHISLIFSPSFLNIIYIINLYTYLSISYRDDIYNKIKLLTFLHIYIHLQIYSISIFYIHIHFNCLHMPFNIFLYFYPFH